MTRVPQWTGFGKKTLWDWLQLLIVPAILIGVTFAWSATQTRSDNKREDRRIAADRAAAEEARQAATLQGYLGEMSGLMLREKLLTSNEGSAVQAVARTVTLTALRRLNGERKAAVVRFLYEAGLLGVQPLATFGVGGPPIVSGGEVPTVQLTGADLTGANLVDASLSGANLMVTDLSRAQLERALLAGADLVGANLVGANLVGAYLFNADLFEADLRRADLRRANLGRANLRSADLRGASLVDAKLVDANPAGPGLQEGAGLAEGLDLGRYIADLTPKQQKEFLDSQEAFLDSLSREELSRFKLSPDELARFRREAGRG